MDDLIDWFGNDIRVVNKSENEITVSVKCNYNAMFYWALQYGVYVEVIEPKDLRKEIAQAVVLMNRKYKGGKDS